MDPEIDADAIVVAVNAAAEAGRGEGLDWATSLTFDTGESCPSIAIKSIFAEEIISDSIHRDSPAGQGVFK